MPSVAYVNKYVRFLFFEEDSRINIIDIISLFNLS